MVQFEEPKVDSQWSQSPCYANWDKTCGVMQKMGWKITPCPLKFGNGGYFEDSCSGGTFEFSPFGAENVPIRVALRAGLTYTFGGSLVNYGLQRSHDGSCDNFVCTLIEQPAPAIYDAPTVATKLTTWGQVKALYRR